VGKAARSVSLGAAAACLAALAGCATVQPWERGTLAKPEMATEAPPHETTQKLRTYSAKEGGAAANGVGGGGCGCN
jgi:outer membrane protein assembly factor BamE (lipoprotein component of BamABCDE complex)